MNKERLSQLIEINLIHLNSNGDYRCHPKGLLKLESHLQIKEDFLSYTAFLKSSRAALLVYHYLNELQEVPKCSCGNDLRLRSLARGYAKTCSTSCSVRNNGHSNFLSEEAQLRSVKTRHENGAFQRWSKAGTAASKSYSGRKALHEAYLRNNTRWCAHRTVSEISAFEYLKSIGVVDDTCYEYPVLCDDGTEFRLDIFVPSLKLDIELDGDRHWFEGDAQRTKKLLELGITSIHLQLESYAEYPQVQKAVRDALITYVQKVRVSDRTKWKEATIVNYQLTNVNHYINNVAVCN